jgi:hypothetical protein
LGDLGKPRRLLGRNNRRRLTNYTSSPTDDPWKLAEQLPHDWNVNAIATGYRGGSTPDDWAQAL